MCLLLRPSSSLVAFFPNLASPSSIESKISFGSHHLLPSPTEKREEESPRARDYATKTPAHLPGVFFLITATRNNIRDPTHVPRSSPALSLSYLAASDT